MIKKSYKAMRTLLQCIYYDLAGKNIGSEGRHLELTLLASININRTFYDIIQYQNTSVTSSRVKRQGLEFLFEKFYRSSHRRCSIKQVFLKVLQNSQENTCVGVSFLIKLQFSGLQKKRIKYRCFPVIFAKILKTLFLQNTYNQLLLILELS